MIEETEAKQPAYQLHIFTLRLWREQLEPQVFEWRGEVKNTSTGEIRYFRDFRALVQLLPMLLVEPVGDDLWAQDEANTPAPGALQLDSQQVSDEPSS